MEEMWKKWLRENNLEYYKEMENSIRWAIEWREGQIKWREDLINKQDEIIYELNVKNKNLEARIKELEDEKLHFYKADGRIL